MRKIFSSVLITALIGSNIAYNYSAYADYSTHDLVLPEFDLMVPLNFDFSESDSEDDSLILQHGNGRIKHREHYSHSYDNNDDDDNHDCDNEDENIDEETGTGGDTGTGSNTGTGTETGTGTGTNTGSNTGTGANTGTGNEVPQFGRIDGFKFNDENAGTFWDVTEPGINGWVITLKSTSSTGSSFTGVTYDNGYFNFSAVPVGSYKLCEVIQAGWTQKYPINVVPDTLDGCFKVDVIVDTNLRYYFGNHLDSTGTGTNTGTGSNTGTGTTGTGSDTGTGSNTGTGTTGTGSDTGTGSQTGSGSNTGTGAQTGTGTQTGTGQQLLLQNNNSNNHVSGGGGGGGSKKGNKLTSFNVDSTIEASGLTSEDLNIVKLYKAYLISLNKLKSTSNLKERETLENYLYGANLSSKYKSQISNIDKKFSKLDKEVKKEMLLKLFDKLEEKEKTLGDNLKIKNLLSYLKLKLAIFYSV